MALVQNRIVKSQISIRVKDNRLFHDFPKIPRLNVNPLQQPVDPVVAQPVHMVRKVRLHIVERAGKQELAVIQLCDRQVTIGSHFYEIGQLYFLTVFILQI